ncbi:unnamed protein product [Alternaria alternata]
MAIRPLNSSLIFDRRVILAQNGYPPLSSKPTSTFSAPLKNTEDPNIVELDYLAIKPNVTDKVRSYWNIPYAADAGGKNRFRGPQPVNRTYGIGRGEKPLDRTSSGIQTRSTEDCLSLNVFTPFDAEPGDDLPVLVNIPGGGFHLPGRSNGGEMVEKARREKGVDGKLDKGIVVVTMYYRNGILRFPPGEQIAKDGDYNNALRDQRAALEWVQKYISAGGASVMLQLTANEGDNYYPVPGTGRKQLFHGAIARFLASLDLLHARAS